MTNFSLVFGNVHVLPCDSVIQVSGSFDLIQWQFGIRLAFHRNVKRFEYESPLQKPVRRR